MRRLLERLAIGASILILVGWGAGALWTSLVGSGENELVRDLAERRSPGLTTAMRGVTWMGSAFVLAPLAFAICVIFLRLGHTRAAIAVPLSLGGAMLISSVVKLLVARPRPPVEHLQAVSGFSFPSGHATQATAFWFSLVLAMRAAGVAQRLTRLALAAALVLVPLVGFSRIYLGVHYPSDVVAGILLGGGWAIYVGCCLRVRRTGSAAGLVRR